MEHFDYHIWIQQLQIYKEYPSFFTGRKPMPTSVTYSKDPQKIDLPERFHRKTGTSIPRKVVILFLGQWTMSKILFTSIIINMKLPVKIEVFYLGDIK